MFKVVWMFRKITARKPRTANVKNAFRNQEAQTRDEYPETAHEVGSPYNSPTVN